MMATMLLPVMATASADFAGNCRAVPGGQRSPLLVLETDRALREAILYALRGILPVEGTGNGSRFLSMIEECLPGMVLLNLQIEDMDPFTVLAQVRVRMPASKVIVTSNSGDFNLVHRVNEYGVGDFIEKPYSLEDLYQSVDNSVRGVLAPVDFRALSARYHQKCRLRRHALLSMA